ncbi:hypothetical protein [Oscillatoria sp. FACHB-1406]|uniref:hypothetical protein n=1 Tax=Oscillatoria sp. FACHB-1406 TaxID=2692846 RepID=UPI001689D038|nr:hypothetical protein [Oscillatoria sp. FACHB-1406]MBD2576090.1 hypothetical protein [Oscillatoria sp. FACHB-1406]
MLSTPLETQIDLDCIVERIFAFRQITRLDQRLLMSVMLSKTEITPEEHMQIDRIFEGVKSGRLQVVD